MKYIVYFFIGFVGAEVAWDHAVKYADRHVKDVPVAVAQEVFKVGDILCMPIEQESWEGGRWFKYKILEVGKNNYRVQTASNDFPIFTSNSSFESLSFITASRYSKCD